MKEIEIGDVVMVDTINGDQRGTVSDIRKGRYPIIIYFDNGNSYGVTISDIKYNFNN